MEICFYQIFIIQNDIPLVSLANFDKSDILNEYITNISNDLINNPSSRQYKFDNDQRTTKDYVSFIISKIEELNNIPKQDEETKIKTRDRLNSYIETYPAYKLAQIEKEFNTSHPQLHSIPKGVLIIAETTNDDGTNFFLLAKADYAEFMEEQSGDKKLGLPTKKKIYKGALFHYKRNENLELEFPLIAISDTSNRDAKYWWSDFLELQPIRTNALNTLHAFKAIKSKVIAPIKNTSKTDYFNLYNIHLSYFSTNDEFDINDFKNKINSYSPLDPNVDINSLLQKLTTLPNSDDFDPSFQKQADSIKTLQKKDVIHLAQNLELSIKGEIENLEYRIKAMVDDEGNKTIVIYSDEGYDYFIRREQ